MSKIDNLNFEIILNDEDFKKKIGENQQLAKDLNVSLSTLLDLQNKIKQGGLRGGSSATKEAIEQQKLAKATADAAAAEERLATARTNTKAASERLARDAANRANAESRAATAALKTEQTQKRVAASVKATNRVYQEQSRILQGLKGMALSYLSVQGATQLLSSLVRVTGEFELQKTTLSAMLGDLNAAENILTKIKELAVESPFQYKELTTYTKQLSAFSVPAEELYETTKMLADISAGLGVGMDRIVLAYGQVRSAAFLRGQEVRQFTEAGIPILDELAKQFEELEGRAVSTGEVFDKISARLVPFEMVAKVFKDMTAEGGKFYQMQEIQAETLRGKLSNLKDAYEMMLNEIGSAHSDKLKGAVDWVRNLMKNWESIGGQLVDLIKLFGAYKTAVALLNISDTIAKFGGLANAIKRTAAAQALMNSALMTNPYIAIGTAITAVAIAIHRQRNALDATTRAQNAYNERVKELSRIDRERANSIRELLDVANDDTKATIEREAALLSLANSYPKIFEQYDLESLKLADILSIKKQIAEEDAKQKRLSALGGIAAQQSRIKALVAQGAGNSYKEDAFAILKQMEKDYLKQFVLPDIISGFKNMTDDALKTALEDAFRKSKIDIRGLEYFDTIPTTQEFYQDLLSAIQKEIKRRENTKEVTGWRKKVQDTLTGLGFDEQHNFGLWAKDTTSSIDYIENLIQRYKELEKEIELISAFDPDTANNLKKEQQTIVAVGRAINRDIAKLAEEQGKGGESPQEKRLKRQIELLRKLQSEYERLKALGVSDDSIKTLFKGLYPEIVAKEGEAFVTSLNYLEEAKKLIPELAKINPDAASKLLTSLSGDAVSDYTSRLNTAIKATHNYYQSMRKLAAEDFNLEGEGIALDISKIASDLREKTNEIDLNATKLKELFKGIDLTDTNVLMGVKDSFEKEFGKGSWDKFYAEFLSKGDDAINDFTNRWRQYEKKLAQESLNDLAQRYVKESTEGLNLSDWGDKSIKQIELIRQRLMTLKDEDIKLPESTIAALAELGLSTDALVAKIKALFGEELDNATIEKFKALSGIIGETISMASSLGDQFIELGNTMGNDYLKGLGNTLKQLDELAQILTECDSLMLAFSEGGAKASENVSEAVEETKELADASETATEEIENIAKSSDWVTMIIKLVVSLMGNVIEGINGSQKALHEARMAAVKYADALNQIEFKNIIDSSESAFGIDNYNKFLDSAKAAQTYGASLSSLVDKLGVTKDELKSLYGDKQTVLFGGNSTKDWADFLGFNMDDIIVDMRNGWQKMWGSSKNIEAFNVSDFINDDGTIKGEELRSFYETYGDSISDANAEAIAEMLGQYDLYVEALDGVADYVSSVFGGVADDVADAFITSFKESGQAALDYGDIMDGVATQIAKDIIKTTLLQEVFNDDLTKKAVDALASGDAPGAMALVEGALESAQKLAPHIQQFLEGLKPYMQMGEEQEGQNLSDGIKGITEDTANLLASYLNAIRADVSFGRIQWQQMNVSLQQITALLNGFSAPSLMEYQAQIAANTYNTALHTQSIMEDLNSVITSEGGSRAIRTIL